MPMCTYLGEGQHTEPTTDDELNELLSDVREATGKDWRIGEQIMREARLLREPIYIKRYTLYNHVGSGEFQLLNIPQGRDHVACYLYGVLGGISDAKKRLEEKHLAEMLEVIDERDNFEEWADKLAHAIGGDAIGEHSNKNNPWQNALDIQDEKDDQAAKDSR